MQKLVQRAAFSLKVRNITRLQPENQTQKLIDARFMYKTTLRSELKVKLRFFLSSSMKKVRKFDTNLPSFYVKYNAGWHLVAKLYITVKSEGDICHNY